MSGPSMLPPDDDEADADDDTTIGRGVEPMALRKRRPARWTDRVEDVAAWLVLATGLLAALFACTFGIGMYDQLAQQGRAEALERTPTTATLLEGAPTIASPYNAGTPVDVQATWEDRTGAERAGLVKAPQGFLKGSTVPIWIDRAGTPVPRPTTSGDALAVAAIITGLIISGVVAALAVLWAVLKHVLMAYNCAAWEQEWREVAPRWSRGEGKRG